MKALLTLVAAASFQFASASEPEIGDLIFQSARLGPTNQYGNGIIISVSQYLGVRFHLPQDTLITAVGGHVWVENFAWAGEFNAFIVRLPSAAALPHGAPFGGDEVVASILCKPTDLPSRDYIFPLSVMLPAGHYALVFGGVGSNARMPGNDEEVQNASYIVWDIDGWRDYPRGGRNGRRALPDYRFTLYGFPAK